MRRQQDILKGKDSSESLEDIHTTAIIIAPTMKSFLVPCSYFALRNGHIIQELPIFLEECKLFEVRDNDLVTFIPLEPNRMLGISAQAIFVE